MKDDLRVFGVVLVPGVVHGFAGASQSQRRDELQLESFGVEEVGQSPVIVTGRFKSDPDRKSQTMEELCERTKILSRILHPNPLSAAPARSFDQSFVAILGYIDAYPYKRFRRTLHNGHGRFISLCECSAHSRYRRLLGLTMACWLSFRSLRSLQPSQQHPNTLGKHRAVPEVLRTRVREPCSRSMGLR